MMNAIQLLYLPLYQLLMPHLIHPAHLSVVFGVALCVRLLDISLIMSIRRVFLLNIFRCSRVSCLSSDSESLGSLIGTDIIIL
jgi:hypothetical protein